MGNLDEIRSITKRLLREGSPSLQQYDVLHSRDKRRICLFDCRGVMVYGRRRNERIFTQSYLLYRDYARYFAYLD